MELHEDIDGDSRMLLYALNLDVVVRHLFGLLGDEIRAQLDLPFLDLPAAATDVAGGYSLGAPTKGFQTLVRTDAGPVAAAPWPGPTLSTLVPLSHMMDLKNSELKESFLHQDGEPLLEGGRYRRYPP
jgi:Immunity protein 61